jgi:hypothetical protein
MLPVFLSGLYVLNREVTTRACVITLGDECVKFERVETREEHLKGLSGRESMPKTAGMLFVFEEDDYYCMWMKDMNFALDMVWLDESSRIIDIERNVHPETYPEGFCPGEPARYVIELNAGIVAEAGLGIDQQLNL